MTPIIIATEQDGYAYVYYRDLAGGLTQVGQVLVGPTQPVELAKIVAEMNDHLFWGKIVPKHDEPEAKVQETKEVLNARQTARRASLNRLKRSKADIAAFDDRVLEVVTARPGVTIPEITRTVLAGAHDKNSMSNVRASLARLADQGKVAKDIAVERNEAHRYSATPAESGHLEADTGLEPTGPPEAPSLDGG